MSVADILLDTSTDYDISDKYDDYPKGCSQDATHDGLCMRHFRSYLADVLIHVSRLPGVSTRAKKILGVLWMDILDRDDIDDLAEEILEVLR